jgi:hypothetical protein
LTRIERAARAADLAMEFGFGTVTEGEMLLILAAAYPEIHADPPTAWLAPWEANAVVDRWLIPEDWEKLRDALLAKAGIKEMAK